MPARVEPWRAIQQDRTQVRVIKSRPISACGLKPVIPSRLCYGIGNKPSFLASLGIYLPRAQ
jgi:hypothetical protein